MSNPGSKELELAFQYEKDTLNTVRFKEVADDKPVIGILYVQKSAMAKLGNPHALYVTITPGDE